MPGIAPFFMLPGIAFGGRPEALAARRKRHGEVAFEGMAFFLVTI